MEVLTQPKAAAPEAQNNWEAPCFVASLNKPIRPPKCELKKASRILKALSHDAIAQYPNLPMPSAWLIRCLVQTHYCGTLNSDWRQAMMWTLTYIKQCSCQSDRFLNSFVELDGITPLFPNDNFTLSDTHLYAKTLLHYLNAQTST